MAKEITREQKIMEGAAIYGSYYRANPHRFARDYLHLDLRLFQKILLLMLNISSIIVFIGSRGIGKSFISAVFCVIRCILYPFTKVVIASGTRGQSIVVLEKIINELVPRSEELKNEIDWKNTTLNPSRAQIAFKNGSSIKVVTAADTARSNRANILLLDEARLIPKTIIDTILRKFLTQRRMPEYAELSKSEKLKEYDKEKNKTIYLSSAFWADHWLFQKCKDVFKFMIDDRTTQFVCGFPYQLPISEGIVDKDTILDEMSETDFNEITFSMEYEALFWGESDGAFFDFASISKNRKIRYPMLPSELSSKLKNDNNIKITVKQPGEKRILSADIALMSSKKHNNDATAIFINQMLPTKSGKYIHNFIYCTNCEGMHTEDQALLIRKLFDEFDCDYIALDTNGVGLGIFDSLVRDMVDSETGEIYPAISCCNDSSMADRCTVQGADKVIWSIKATSALNSDCAVLLREGFRSGKIRLLATEYDAEESLGEIGAYNKLTDLDKYKVKAPFIHTTLLIDELIKLNHDESNGKVRIFERSGMRKDRYSSIAYNYYVATQIESKLIRKQNNTMQIDDLFVIKAPKIKSTGKAVRGIGRPKESSSWK